MTMGVMNYTTYIQTVEEMRSPENIAKCELPATFDQYNNTCL